VGAVNSPNCDIHLVILVCVVVEEGSCLWDWDFLLLVVLSFGFLPGWTSVAVFLFGLTISFVLGLVLVVSLRSGVCALRLRSCLFCCCCCLSLTSVDPNLGFGGSVVLSMLLLAVAVVVAVAVSVSVSVLTCTLSLPLVVTLILIFSAPLPLLWPWLSLWIWIFLLLGSGCGGGIWVSLEVSWVTEVSGSFSSAFLWSLGLIFHAWIGGLPVFYCTGLGRG